MPCTAASIDSLVVIYQCFCDGVRLRILNLLAQGPLCVCHLQEILDQPQVRISKQLAYLREKGLVQAERHQNWMIYSLPETRAPELDANLRCLQDCVQTDPVFAADLRGLARAKSKTAWVAEQCAAGRSASNRHSS
jgi:DNA-binding transcriptional ArsR family regulator